jgi:hypothetical protein
MRRPVVSWDFLAVTGSTSSLKGCHESLAIKSKSLAIENNSQINDLAKVRIIVRKRLSPHDSLRAAKREVHSGQSYQQGQI